jgi:uncharacterized protein YbjT (DUF2867 family)
VDHLAQELKDRRKAGFSSDEAASPQIVDPSQRLLNRRGEVVVRFVAARRIETSKPPSVGRCPVLEVLLGRAREPGFAVVVAEPLVQREQLVIELIDQALGRDVAVVGVDEDATEKAEDQGDVVRCEETPGSVAGSQLLDLVVVHVTSRP